MQNHVQTQSLIYYFLNATQETKQNQPQNITSAAFVNAENSAKSSTKEQIQITINKTNTTSIDQKIYNTLIRINIFNDSTNVSEKNNIKQHQNKECQVENNVC